MSKVTISEKAKDDLIAIARHGRHVFGKVQAQRYHTELQALFQLIATNPRMARERFKISTPV